MKVRKVTSKIGRKSAGADALLGVGLIAGMVIGKGINKLAGDTLLVNSATAATGLTVAAFIEDPSESQPDLLTKFVKGAAFGGWLFGSLKAVGSLGQDVTPVGVNGLGFTAPEGVRKLIKDYWPTPMGQVEPERAFANIAGYNQYGAIGSLELPELSGGTNDNNPAVLAGLSAAI